MPLVDDSLIEAKRRQRLLAKREVSRRFTVLNLLANALLAAAKGAAAVFTGSLALAADAFNSLADTAYSLVLMVGMHFSLQPADRSHPQGHRAMEPLISLAIGVSIAVVAYELFSRGVRGLFSPPDVEQSLWAILVLVVAMGVKVWISLRARRNAREIHSPALMAVSKDSAADVFATLAALVGYAGAYAGYDLADPIFGLVVAVFVARTAYHVLHENIGYITGRSAPPEIEQRVLEVACEPDTVCAVHDLKAYFRGPELHVSFHLEIDRHESFERVHDIEQRVRLALLDIPEVDEVAVHLDPVDTVR